MKLLSRLPLMRSLSGYHRGHFTADLTAAVIVTIMLIPQSLAYAMLAGMPPETGLYASILPLAAYAIFGSSRVLSVGPVAVISLMTAGATASVSAQTGVDPVSAAAWLALVSGALMLVFGLLRGGVVADALSHPVISGFITASALMIAWGQLTPLLGGDILAGALNPATAMLGLAALAALWAGRKFVKGGLGKAVPLVVVGLAGLASFAFDFNAMGISTVGVVPAGLPVPHMPDFSLSVLQAVILPAALLSLVGFVESVSVGRSLAAKTGGRIDADQELVGLGAANLAAGAMGGFPVTGGFSRSVVNFDAGAKTQVAGVLTAALIAVTTLTLAPALQFLPQAVLAATIIIAVIGLVDLHLIRRAARYSKGDLAAVLATIATTLVMGVEAGIALGVGLSVILFIMRTARPHIAEVGCVPGTEHFRNITRHAVETTPEILSLRVDGSLYFANARMIGDDVRARAANRPDIRHVILQMTAVNGIDLSGLETLEELSRDLAKAGITLHLSEVKGPVADRLARAKPALSGQVFLSQWQAVNALKAQATTP